MDGKLDLEDVYAKRLQAVRPTREQIREIRRVYKRNIVEDAKEVIAALHDLGHNVYIISGGLAEPVEEFGVYLGVPKERIRAVNVDYNQLSGKWWEAGTGAMEVRYLDYEEGALTVSDGKAQIVKELLGDQNGRSLLIGDGSSDLLAGKAVNLFVGFGGVVARQKVVENSPVFMHSPSISPILALAAGPAAYRQTINTNHENLFRKALELTKTGALSFKDERIKSKFTTAFDATYQTLYPGTD